MSCGCQKAETKNLLHLIRRVETAPPVSETFEIEKVEQEEEKVKPELSTEEIITIKRLEDILRKIEKLRYKKDD